MKPVIQHILGVVLLAALISSCKKDNTETTPVTQNYLKVADAVSANSAYALEMCAKDSLFVGYNELYFKVTDKTTGQLVKQATITLMPIMDMGSFKHSCPFENPQVTANSDGYFEGAILFSMIGTDSWSVDAYINAGGTTDSVHLAIPRVIITDPVRKIVVIDSLETTPGTWKVTKYPISLVVPPSWTVGNNTFEITIHQMAGMMSFPPVTDMNVEITPEMPSMGHGSPNNINPIHTANGHYAGSVNFTMTGDWRVHLSLSREGRLISNKAYFDILF